MPQYEIERQSKGRRAEDCGKCPDHTGMVEKDNSQLSWTKATFTIMSVGLTLMGYSVLWQAPKIDLAVAEVRLEINNIRSEMKAADGAMDKRVTCLEEVVYRGGKK